MSAASLISQGYGGYAGWNDAEADQNFAATKGQGKLTGAPTQQPAQQPAAQGFGGAPAVNATNGNPRSAQDLIGMGYGGYAGWNDTEALANFKATQGSGKYTAQNNATNGLTNTPTIDLPGLYEKYTQDAGIGDMQKGLTAKTKSYNDAMSAINDNPYLSEANRVGRAQKLTEDYNNNIKTDQNALAMAQADVQSRIAIQTKQFDINSQQTQQALGQFNTLLNNGALDNASGQDIANITKATGLSSGMIQSAIQANVAKNTPKVPTQVIPFNDGNSTGYAVINSQTGELISKQVVAGAAPTKYNGGTTSSSGSGGGGSSSTPKAPSPTQQQQSVSAVLQDYISNKQSRAKISPEDLYRELLIQFPGAAAYINKNWTAQQIRAATGG